MSSGLARSFARVAFALGAVLPLTALGAQAGVATPPDSSDVLTSQITTTPGSSSVDSLAVAGPRVVRAGIGALLAIRSVPAVAQRSDARVGAGSNVAMMGVGLAAIVVGSLIGGDGGTIIALGGGVIGLIGLFRYLR